MTQWLMNGLGGGDNMWRRIQMFPKITSAEQLLLSREVQRCGKWWDRKSECRTTNWCIHWWQFFPFPRLTWRKNRSWKLGRELRRLQWWAFGDSEKFGEKKDENDSCWVLISECFREVFVFAGLMLYAASWCFVSMLVELNPLKTCKHNTRKEERIESIFLHSYVYPIWNVNTCALPEGVRASTKQHRQCTIVCRLSVFVVSCMLYVKQQASERASKKRNKEPQDP